MSREHTARPAKKKHPNEIEFMKRVMLALGSGQSIRLWRQNVGQVPVRDHSGKVLSIFDAGPPNGAADISGVVIPEGWRLEIEVKAAKGKRSKDQEQWAENVERWGCVYVLVDYDPALDIEANVELAQRKVRHTIEKRRLGHA